MGAERTHFRLICFRFGNACRVHHRKHLEGRICTLYGIIEGDPDIVHRIVGGIYDVCLDIVEACIIRRSASALVGVVGMELPFKPVVYGRVHCAECRIRACKCGIRRIEKVGKAFV